MQRNICIHIFYKSNQTLLLHFIYNYHDNDDNDNDLNLKFLWTKLTEVDRFEMLSLFCFS